MSVFSNLELVFDVLKVVCLRVFSNFDVERRLKGKLVGGSRMRDSQEINGQDNDGLLVLQARLLA